MPNHLHALIGFTESKKSINRKIGDGKRFIGYEIIKRLTEKNEKALLTQLSGAVNSSDRKRGKLYELWEDSFDWKECTSRAFVEQKLLYMHNNPCSGKYNMVTNPEDYTHSSAKYYLTGLQGVYTVTDYTDLEDIDLTKPNIQV